MTLSYGRTYLAIPGPSVIPDRVLRAMHHTSPDIYGGPLVEMVPGLIDDLKSLAGTEGHATIYIANGHGAWEAALSNVLAPGDRVLALVSGAFGQGWAAMAEALGGSVEVMDFGRHSALDPAQVARRLRADTDRQIRAVLAVHVDTSTSVRADIAALRRAMDEAGHPALLMVDCIASLGADRFEMDAWGVDVMVAASQKGLMGPPGLGFVFFNDRAAAARDRLARVSPYWDWRPRAAPELFYHYFGGTAPVHALAGLREALDMIAEEGGMPAVWARHEKLARAVWAACDVWGRQGSLRLNVPDPDQRSHAVTAITMEAPDADRLRQWCTEKAGVTLGIALGMEPAAGNLRIGHMGHVNAHMVLGVLGAMEAGMTALNIAHGAGGVEAAAKVIATA